LERFYLRLCGGFEIALPNVKVIKLAQRHMVKLVNGVAEVTLVRVKHDERLIEREKGRRYEFMPEVKKIYAYSEQLGLDGRAVSEIPQFIVKLLQ